MDIKTQSISGDNIIRFPAHRSKRIRQFISDMDIKKFAASASLASMLFVVPLIHGALTGIQSTNSSSQGRPESRAIASLGDQNYVRDSINQNATPEIVRMLASQSIETLPAVGELPSALENFQFGELAGQYNVKSQDGKVVGLSEREGQGLFKKVEDYASFLKTNREVWPVAFDSVNKDQELKVKDRKSEVYSLQQGSKKVAKVTVLSDKNGNLISLSVQTLQ